MFTFFPGCEAQTSADRCSRRREALFKSLIMGELVRITVKSLTQEKVPTFRSSIRTLFTTFLHAGMAKKIFEIRSIGSKNGRDLPLPGLPDRPVINEF